MAEDQLRNVIDGMRARLQAELEAQLGSLSESHAQAIEQARRASEADAEQRYSASLQSAREELSARFEAEVAAARAETEAEWSTRLNSELAAARAETEAVRDQLSATLQSELAAARAESEAIRTEFDSRLQTEVSAVRAEVERTIVAESMRARVEAEQAAAESASQARREMEQALTSERQQAQQQIDAARQQAQAQVEAARQRAERELAQVRATLEAEQARASEAAERDRASQKPDSARGPSPSPDGEPGLLDSIRAVDAAASLSDALVAVVRGAAREAPRAALFMIDGTQLQEWPAPGLPALHAGPIREEELETGLLAEALRRGEPVTSGRGDGPPAPAFASLPAGRIAVAVPFVLGGTPVAVLYADEGPAGEAPASWPDRVQILGRHASAYLAYVTAMRTAQALRLLSASSTGAARNTGQDAEPDDAQGARRYARLLVSEIKLYNESAVRLGRERRDLLQRLKPEIERARRLYDERVAPSIRSRDVYFRQELVQTLADGDHSLLG
jgi:chemotaxis protein histidine kinase CheA